MITISCVSSFSAHKHIYHNLEDTDQNGVFPKESWVSGVSSYLQSKKQELHIYHFQVPIKFFSTLLVEELCYGTWPCLKSSSDFLVPVTS